MKNISDIYEANNLYEGILDNDDDVKTGVKRSLITPAYLKDAFGKCLPDVTPDDVHILDDGKLDLFRTNYRLDHDMTMIADIPDLIQFERFNINISCITISGDKVTTLRGLPEDLSRCEIYIENCPNLKDTSAVKSCKVLYISDTDVKKLKSLPKAIKFIRLLKNCGDVDVKYVSKISGVPKNKITIL